MLYCDSQSAIDILKNSQFHVRTKYIDIKYHFVQDIAERELISIGYCPTMEMSADMFTKALPAPQLTYLSRSVGLRSA